MTTITIKDGKPLSRKVFKTFEDLIEEYYASKGGCFASSSRF